MKRRLLSFLLAALPLLLSSLSPHVRAESETIDLKALAKKARPAVMLLVVSDVSGKEIATGTGFLVSSDGKLITNHHVIEGAASAVAKAENGGLFPIEGVLADDPKNDLVLLKLKGKDLPFLPLGNSDKIEVGTRIAVIGSPLGLEGTLSEGIVSAVRELMGNMHVLQITAAISPGSSGSPVLDAKGDVIGVARALLGEGQALNFAVPVEVANRMMAKAQPRAKPRPFGQLDAGGRDAIFSDPDFLAASAAEANGDRAQQLKRSQTLVRRYPDNAGAWYSLGVAYGGLEFTDDAIAAYRQAIKLKPDYVDAWCNLGVLNGKAGRTDGAIAAFRQALKLKPDDAELWYNLGVTYAKVGRADDAIAAYRQAIKLKPDYAEAWCNLGGNYDDAGRTEEAISAYQQAIKLMRDETDTADAWINLGMTYRGAGRMDEAISAFQHAIKFKPDSSKAWLNLGLTYEKAGRMDDARDAFQQAKKLEPESLKNLKPELVK